ncbi:MAG: hypothetical protein ACYCSN_14615 [Acidobacteriaceae bacterium]
MMKNRNQWRDQDKEQNREPYLEVFLQPDGSVRLLPQGCHPPFILRKAWATELRRLAERLPLEDPRSIAREIQTVL